MKNILIPTILEADTVCAVKTAIRHTDNNSCSITLMLLHEVTECYSSLYVLSHTKSTITKAQNEVLKECRELVNATENCTLALHNQYGLSRPILKNLIEHLSIDIILLCESYKTDQNKIHCFCNKLLLNSKYTILHLGTQVKESRFSKALYLQNSYSPLGVQELQEKIKGRFKFQIVSQAEIEEQENDKIAEMILNVINKNGIDLVVHTRKSKQKISGKKNDKKQITDVIGLPVLSFCEESV
ncbi:hypothetical protein E0W68_10550 [Flavobacterium salilacus subsp. salilacus]|uniref:hypothetical protein n=1 Tax=Flavobacterium TaxID=237 RepID=UPI001075077D|nr:MULTISPECIES: hypothetical protein [Flavobacterium]KAF2518168.1 hypothetical protein E0W68_10550 [Flavobacterium salilacus subsp. salilacus]MBE1615521.1 hypothetical protein [Flavobacterium sp. SaA2.13]